MEEIREGLRFTEAALDMINHLEEEAREAAMDAIDAMMQQVELDKELSVINMGSRSEPNLYVSTTEGVNLGTIDIPLEGNVTVRLEANWEQEQQIVDSLKANLDHFDKAMKECHVPEQEALELTSHTPQMMEQMASVQEATVNRVETMKEIAEQSRQKALESGINPEMYDKIVGKDLSALEKEAQKAEKEAVATPSLWQQRKEMQTAVKDERKEIQNLAQSIRNRTAYAHMNGVSQDDRSFINGAATAISDHAIKLIAMKETMPSKADCIKDWLQRTADSIKENAKNCINTINGAIDRGIQAGKNALQKIDNAVERANEKFRAQGISAYTGLTEQVAQISRAHMAVAYSVDKTIADNMDKLRGSLEKAFDRGAEIKAALKDGVQNIGRAFTGQDRVTSEAQLTPAQQSVIGFLKENSEALHADMDKQVKDCQVSFDSSRYQMEQAQEYREVTGLDRSKGLEKMEGKLEQSQRKFTMMTDATLDECRREAAAKNAERRTSSPQRNAQEMSKDLR